VKYVAVSLAAAVVLVIVRAWLMRALPSRAGRQSQKPAPPPADFRTRLNAALAWPVFFVLVGIVLMLGVFVGSVVGNY
jgi:ABC-type Fe3+ transport system permease subunit